MEDAKKIETYKKLEKAFIQLEECLVLLEKQEKQLHQEILQAIDIQRMEKIKNRITNLKDF